MICCIICLIIFAAIPGSSLPSTITNQVEDTVCGLGWKNVTVLHLGDSLRHSTCAFKAFKGLVMKVQGNIICTNASSLNSVIRPGLQVIILSTWSLETRLSIAEMATQNWYLRAANTVLLVMPPTLDSLKIEEWLTVDFNETLGFYLLHGHDLWEATTFKNEEKFALHQMVEVNSNSSVTFGRYKTIYNFKGIELTSITIPYVPYFYEFECSEGNHHCSFTGLLKDVLKQMEFSLNFTTDVWKPSSGLWQNNDPTAANSELGVMEHVMTGNSDISLSLWAIFDGRSEILDFSSVNINLNRHLITRYQNLNNNKLSLSFFTKPFTLASWISIIVAAIMCAVLHKYAHMRTGERMFLFLGGTLFVLINAFYGGALTSFLTVSGKLPFSTLREGIVESDWNPIYLSINIPFFRLLPQKKDIDFIHALDEMINKPDFRADNISEIARLLAQPSTFVSIPGPRVEAVIQAWNNQGHHGTDVLAKLGTTQFKNTFIYRKNSPLKRVIDSALQRMAEIGSFQANLVKGINLVSLHDATLDKTDGFSPINLEHTALGFVFLASALVLSAAIFMFELLLK